MRTTRKLSEEEIGQRIRALRAERRLSMRELASASGLSVSFLSRVESGKTCLSVMSLQKILEALDIDLYEFFMDSATANPGEQIVFPKAGMLVSDDGERRWHCAFPKHPDIKMELTYEEYDPRPRLVEDERHKTDIGGIVLSGVLEFSVKGKGVYRVHPGDAFYIKAGKVHSAKNIGDVKLRIVSVRPQRG